MLVLLVAHKRLSLCRLDQVGVHIQGHHCPGRAPFPQDEEDGKPIICSWRRQSRTHKEGVEAVTILASRSTGGPQGSRLLPKTTQVRPPAPPTAPSRPTPAKMGATCSGGADSSLPRNSRIRGPSLILTPYQDLC